MKSFVKGLWSRTKSTPKPRALDNVEDLLVGDMIQLSDSYGLPPRLRDQQFRVIGIVTYQFEHEFQTTFNLEGINDDHLDLTINNEAGRQSAAFSLSVDQSRVEQIFDMDGFSQVFDGDALARLSASKHEGFEHWLADDYQQEIRAERGYFHNQDCRAGGPSKFDGDGEAFDYYFLVTLDRTHGVEIEVYGGGETEVSLTIFRPVTDIKELWPAAPAS